MSDFWDSVFGKGLEEKSGRSGGSEMAATHGTHNSRSRDHRSASLLLRR
jgi:hypothetical protein